MHEGREPGASCGAKRGETSIPRIIARARVRGRLHSRLSRHATDVIILLVPEPFPGTSISHSREEPPPGQSPQIHFRACRSQSVQGKTGADPEFWRRSRRLGERFAGNVRDPCPHSRRQRGNRRHAQANLQIIRRVSAGANTLRRRSRCRWTRSRAIGRAKPCRSAPA